MLFPVTPEYEQMRKKQDQDVLDHGVEGVEDVIYFKQTSRSRNYYPGVVQPVLM